MAGTRSPLLNRQLHDSVGVGKVTFPPNPLEGVAIVEISTAQKIDAQKASGTDKAKTKRQGKDSASVKITLRWTYRIDDEVQEILAYVDPEGPHNGGPFALVHPKAERRRVKDIIIEKMSDVKNITPALYEVTLEAMQWNPPSETTGRAAAATVTPKISQEWQDALGAAVGKNFARSGIPAEIAVGLEGYDALKSLDGPDDKP
jgi:hypothetical protein